MMLGMPNSPWNRHCERFRKVGSAILCKDIQEMRPAVEPPIKSQHREKPWKINQAQKSCLLFGKIDTRKLEQREGLLTQTMAQFIGSLSVTISSIVLELELRPDHMQWSVITRNAQDMNIVRNNFQGTYEHCFAEKPIPLFDSPFYQAVEELKQRSTPDVRLGLTEYYLPAPAYNVLSSPGRVSSAYHPLQSFPELAKALQPGETVVLQIILYPASPNYWDLIRGLGKIDQAKKLSQLRMLASNTHTLDYDKDIQLKLNLTQPLFSFILRRVSIFRTEHAPIQESLFSSLYQDFLFGSSALTTVTQEDYKKIEIDPSLLLLAIQAGAPISKPGLLPTTDIAKFFPPPNSGMLEKSNVHIPLVRAFPAIIKIPPGQPSVPIATDPYNHSSIFSLPLTSYMACEISGLPGVGKSTFMLNLAKHILPIGNPGALFILPYATPEEIIGVIPPHRYKDTVYIDMNSDQPIALQTLEQGPNAEQSIANHRFILETMARHNAASISYGHNIDQLLVHTLDGITAPPAQHPTFQHARRFVVDKTYRDHILKHTTSQKAREYFNTVFKALEGKRMAPTHSFYPILAPVIDGPIGDLINQLHKKISLSELINENKIIVLNLRPHELGFSGWIALATMISMLAINAVMQSGRKNSLTEAFWFFADEVHSYAHELLGDGVVQGRNMSWRSILSMQTPRSIQNESLRARIQAAPYSFVFSSSPTDAFYYKNEVFLPPSEIVSLPPHEFYFRQKNKAIHLRSLPPPQPVSKEVVARIKQASEQRYGGVKPVYDKAYFQALLPPELRQEK